MLRGGLYPAMKPSQASTAWLLLPPFDSSYASIFQPFLFRRHLFGNAAENVEVKEEAGKTTFWLCLLTYIGRFVVVVVVAASKENPRRIGADPPRRSQPCNAAAAADGCRAPPGRKVTSWGAANAAPSASPVDESTHRLRSTLPTSFNNRTNTGPLGKK